VWFLRVIDLPVTVDYLALPYVLEVKAIPGTTYISTGDILDAIATLAQDRVTASELQLIPADQR
jgi:hypothetical protein